MSMTDVSFLYNIDNYNERNYKKIDKMVKSLHFLKMKHISMSS